MSVLGDDGTMVPVLPRCRLSGPYVLSRFVLVRHVCTVCKRALDSRVKRSYLQCILREGKMTLRDNRYYER